MPPEVWPTKSLQHAMPPLVSLESVIPTMNTSWYFAKEQDVEIFVIGIVNPSGELAPGQSGRSTIEDLAQIGDGEAFFPDSIDQLEDICNKIGLELRNQYFWDNTQQTMPKMAGA
jgi:hypothetical protein